MVFCGKAVRLLNLFNFDEVCFFINGFFSSCDYSNLKDALDTILSFWKLPDNNEVYYEFPNEVFKSNWWLISGAWIRFNFYLLELFSVSSSTLSSGILLFIYFHFLLALWNSNSSSFTFFVRSFRTFSSSIFCWINLRISCTLLMN